MAMRTKTRGAKKDLKDKHNNSALRLAESKQNPAIITLLGGDPNAKKQVVDSSPRAS